MAKRSDGVTVTKRRRRGRTEHWAKWSDPDTGQRVSLRLDAMGLTTKETRADWVATKATALRARRAEITSGAPVRRDLDPSEGVRLYLSQWAADLRERTKTSYRETLDVFVGWASRRGIRSLWDLDRRALALLRDEFANRPARAAKRRTGGKDSPKVGRGAKRVTNRRRAPSTINKDLRQLAAFVQAARRSGYLALTSDDIRDGLRLEKVTREKPRPMTPQECRAAFKALLAYDDREPVEPMSDLFAVLLLTGMRLGEALGLRWSDVDVDAERIHLRGTAVKTRRARVVLLTVCPAVVAILRRLRLRRGGGEFVFGGAEPLARYHVHNAVPRVRALGAPPRFSPQVCRQTTAAVLVNAPSVANGRNPLLFEARQLGHSVVTSEAHYLDLLPPISADATTVEAACGIADILTPLTGSAPARDAARAATA